MTLADVFSGPNSERYYYAEQGRRLRLPPAAMVPGQ